MWCNPAACNPSMFAAMCCNPAVMAVMCCKSFGGSFGANAWNPAAMWCNAAAFGHGTPEVAKHGAGSKHSAAGFTELPKAFVLRLDVPGCTSKDIQLHLLDQHVLKIVCCHDEAAAAAAMSHTPHFCYKFTRHVRVPAHTMADSLKAKVEHGILTVTIDKAADSPSYRTIHVE
jgi:HSP20 family molecular chaperone IbpA